MRRVRNPVLQCRTGERTCPILTCLIRDRSELTSTLTFVDLGVYRSMQELCALYTAIHTITLGTV